MTRLVLASASPRRKRLMEQIGLMFDVIPSDCDESSINEEYPQELVCKLAELKARSVAAKLYDQPDTVVVGADTVVATGFWEYPWDREILGKPKDEADARRMLRKLSGRRHRVDSAVCVVSTRDLTPRTTATFTTVTFRHLSDREISAYIASGEPMDKAGAYGIQQLGATFVERIEGDYFAVVGLSLTALCERLSGFGIRVL